jgi:hypothetical protein
VSGSTNTTPANYRRGYIESWNLFIQGDLGANLVANLGYVGTRAVRQLAGVTLNATPLPNGLTPCMANGQYNHSTPYYTHALGKNPCNFAANETINTEHCAGNTSATCYNTGGITMNEPIFSANYNGLQGQLTRLAGRSSQFGLVYTWSKAMDDEDNGAGSGSAGTAFSYPAYFGLNRALASYDRKNNLQFWGIYTLPFGAGQRWVNNGIAGAIVGGFQLNGQLSHVSGAPFSVSPSASTINSPGNTQYASLVKPYHQLGGHNRTPRNAPFPAAEHGSIQRRSPIRRSLPIRQLKRHRKLVLPSSAIPTGTGSVARGSLISTPVSSVRSTYIASPPSRFALRRSMR